jgi:hypothetical protein
VCGRTGANDSLNSPATSTQTFAHCPRRMRSRGRRTCSGVGVICRGGEAAGRRSGAAQSALSYAGQSLYMKTPALHPRGRRFTWRRRAPLFTEHVPGGWCAEARARGEMHVRFVRGGGGMCVRSAPERGAGGARGANLLDVGREIHAAARLVLQGVPRTRQLRWSTLRVAHEGARALADTAGSGRGSEMLPRTAAGLAKPASG